MKMLSNLRTKLRTRLNKNLISNQSGQGATEYILLVAVVVGIVLVFGNSIKSKLTGATDKLGGQIDSVVDSSAR